MTELLAGLGIVGGIGAIAAIVTLALKLAGAKDDQIAAMDLLDKEREQHRVTRGELEVETAAHAATRDELRKEKQLRTDVEAQRNQCVREDRENTVKLIENSGIADAVHLGNRILSAPLPGTKLSESGDAALEKP